MDGTSPAVVVAGRAGDSEAASGASPFVPF